jgi:heme-degrading monooxygenase HmoA
MVTVINRLTVTGDRDEFERILGELTAYMKRQPGFLSHHLYRSVRDPNVYVEFGEWRDAVDHQRAMKGEEFLSRVPEIMKHAKAEPDVFDSLTEGAAAH